MRYGLGTTTMPNAEQRATGAAEADTALLNQALLEKIASDDPQMVKAGQDVLNDYLRLRVREDGFTRRIIPEQTITAEDLDRQVDTDKPVVIIDKEPDAPAAYSVPFGTGPIGHYLTGPRARIVFDRIETPRFMKDVAELHTYKMDLRQIISDNSLKDVLAEEDGRFIQTVNTMLGGPGVVLPEVGVALWQQISGGITRETLAESMKVMPRTPNRLAPATVLVNNVTIWDIVKWRRDHMGGDLSQELAEQGFAERTFMGVRWLITIKRDLVPDGTIFQFAEPKYLGVFLVFEDITMWMKREAFMLEWFAYESVGCLIGNIAAIARIDFTP